MVTGCEHIGLGFHCQGTDGNPAAQPLGNGDPIGLDAQLLVTPEAATAPHAHLHLIKDQQNLMLVADLAQLAEKLRVARHHAPLPLERFD